MHIQTVRNTQYRFTGGVPETFNSFPDSRFAEIMSRRTLLITNWSVKVHLRFRCLYISNSYSSWYPLCARLGVLVLTSGGCLSLLSIKGLSVNFNMPDPSLPRHPMSEESWMPTIHIRPSAVLLRLASFFLMCMVFTDYPPLSSSLPIMLITAYICVSSTFL